MATCSKGPGNAGPGSMLAGFVLFEFLIVSACFDDDLELGWPRTVVVTNKNYCFKSCLNSDSFSTY